MGDNEELRQEELICLESLLAPEEFQKTSDRSGVLEVRAFVEDGFEVLLVDSMNQLSYLDDWFSGVEEVPQASDGSLADPMITKHARLEHLPPIRMKFALPADYPLSAPPEVTVSACWIPKRMLHYLEARIRNLWKHNGCQAVLYEAFMEITELSKSGRFFPFSRSHLPIFSREELQSNPIMSLLESKNCFVVSNASALFTSLQHYDENRAVVVYQQSAHRCNICYETLPGSTFIRLTNCRHFVCKNCIRNLCISLIKDGAVHKLQCMECSTELNPFDIEASVETNVWDRYQKYQLDSALSSMQDIVYCPRPWCNQAVMKEGESAAGRCPGCAYVFCIYCKRGFHGIEPCPLDAEKRIIVEEYDKADPKTKVDMEKRFGKVRLKNLSDEIKAEEWVSQNAKQCPKCQYPVEKMGGCNKMVCTKCGSAFCWLCLKKLSSEDPYGHFQDPSNKDCYMNLLLGITADENADEALNEDLNDIEGENIGDGWFDLVGRDNGALAELRQALGLAVALLDRL